MLTGIGESDMKTLLTLAMALGGVAAAGAQDVPPEFSPSDDPLQQVEPLVQTAPRVKLTYYIGPEGRVSKQIRYFDLGE